MKKINLIEWLSRNSHEKQKMGGMRRYAAMLIMLLTLGVGQMWGGTVSGGEIYFDATQSGWGNSLSSVEYIISHDGHSCWYAMTKIPNTNLYYISSGSWGDSKYFAFTGNYGWTSCEDNSYDHRKGYGPSGKKYTAKSTYGVNSGSTYLFYASSSADDASITTSSPAGYLGDGKTYTALNYTQTLNQTLSTNGGSTYSTSTASIATVKVSSYKLNGASSSTSTSGTIAAASSSTSCSAARTATVKYTVSSIATGYEFVGWYDGSTQKSTSTTYTYNATGAKTITARFKETQYSLTFSHNGHGSIAVGGNTVSSGSTANVNYFTTMTLVASPSTGYNFSGWTKSGSNTGSVTIGDESAGGTSTTIKATNTGATVTANFTPKTYTITLDKNGGNSDGAATATYNSSTLSVSSHASRTDYRIDGYYAESGLTTKVINADGTFVANVSGYTGAGGIWTRDEDTKLYAKWVYDVTEYTVTFAVGTSYTSLGGLTAYNNTTFSAISTGANVRSGQSVTFTAAPNTGYAVEGWYTNAACTEGKHNAGSTTYTTSIGAATNVYVKFVEKTWSVAFAAGTGGTVTTPAATPQTVGQVTGISIAATPATGYTFNTWTITSGSGSFTSAKTTNSNTFKPTADATVTASFNETMRTITIVGGTSTSTTAGVATTGSATAAAPAAGKKFTGWSLGAGVTLSGGSLTDQTINFTATANATVTANYADRAQVKMYFAKPTSLSWGTLYAYAWQNSNTSNNNKAYPGVELSTTEVINCVTYYVYQYYTEGDGIGGAATGNSAWDRVVFGCNEDTKKTGDLTISNGHYYYKTSSGTGKAAAITSAWSIEGTMNSWSRTANYITHDCANNKGTATINLTGGNTYEFKVYNEVNNQEWSNSEGLGTGHEITETMASAYQLYNNDANVMKVIASVSGDYTFEVSATNASNPKIKVSFPEVYAIAGSFNSWSSTANPLVMDGNTGTADIVLAPSGSNYTLKVVDNGAMYGKNSTTITTTATVSGMVVGQSNINLKADIYPASANPSYRFSYDKSAKALTVTYPAAHTVTYGVGTHAGTASVTSSISVASGKKILDAQSITFSKGSTNTGYTWKGWYNNAAGSSSALGTGATYTSSSRAANTSVYACYDLVNYTITYNLNGGSNPVSPAPATSFTIESAAITLPTPTKTGYTFAGWYENADLSTGGVKTTIPAGSTGNKIYWAKWTPITYTIHFNGNGATSGTMSNQTGIAYDSETTITTNAFVKTGYNFAGWATSAGGEVVRADGAAHGNLSSTQGATVELYAKWNAKQCTIKFDFDESDTGYGSKTGATNSTTATYAAAMTSVTPPTAAEGYAFMGFYDAADGAGTQYYDGTGASVTNWDKDIESPTTLYAYYKKAEITDVELNETMFDPVAAGDGGYVVANPTIAPNPTGDHIICWELLYDNDNPVTGHDAIDDSDGSHPDRVKFSIAGLAAGGYKIRTTLRTGSSCAGGTLLDTRVTTFQIANAFTVTVEYKDSEGNTIAASTTSPGKALESTDITAPDLIGYTFSTWQLGEGMSTEEALTTKTDFSYKTTFNSTLTAVYTKKRMIYFNNTLGWESVYVYFYKNDSYWETAGDKRGSGSKTTSTWTDTPYELGKHGQMQPVSEGSNIYYFDAEAEGVPSSYDDVVFTEDSQHNYEFFHKTNAVRRGDYKTSLPMFVPVPKTEQTADVYNETNYYNHGYWMNYPENTGYVLHIYNSKTYGASDGLMSIPFEYTADKTMPMSLTVELAGGKEYGFEIHRADSKIYGTDTKVMKNGDSGDDGTGWALAENKRTGLLTSVAGDYTFTLNYGNSGGYNFLAGVHYPVAANDYRVVYNDRVAWSLGSAHDASWYHPSRAIEKKDGAEDIVSFYVSKEEGASASMKFQYASSVSGEGVVTWSDVDGGSISLSDITESGVYNFYLSQAAGSITVDSIRPYTGQYYIRSQAVTGGWDNYRVGSDHKMTYSEFSESAANTFGEKFSHYKAKWCPRNTNIAFTIANDYSMCITDTLKQDVGNPYSNTDADGKLNNDGNPGHDGSNAYLDPNSANVRFMWNRKTNKISRAYVASSTSMEARFLVLQGSGTTNANIFDENGSDLSATPPGANATLLRDDQNWIYEITVQANPSALVKLFANYKGQTQYFRGTSDPGFEKGTSAVELLGGTSSSTKYSVRVVYDFKTNRLVTAWQPTGTTEEIDGVLNINADVMVIRKHHESAQCITFANDESALNGVKTVYGVMQFNRWILNNREHPEDDTPEHCADASAIATYHRPLAIGDQKSIYERSHYYISFPFDVRLSDVFGFGQYWNEWYIEWYDGLTRAKNGYWIDSPSNWKYVTPEEKDNFVLKANQGYILGLDMDYMQATDFTFWSNKNTTIELYFPSTVSLETLKSTEVTIPALNTIEGDPYRCTINRENGDDGDRRIKDSYWRCIGVPSFNIYNSTLMDEEGNPIEWKDDYEWKEDDAAFPFIYLWNKADNTITPQATSEFSFQPMHAYLVQNGGAIVWTAVSAKPSSIVARQRNTEQEEYNWRLELQQNEQMIDRTYIRMKDLESVTDGFDFGQDMSKEFNKKRSAIFSFIGTEKVAANSMPVYTDQTTIVPLGLDIKSAGEYVISLPEGTNGVGVVLVDSITGTRTNLAFEDYEIYLEKGTISDRFELEININNTPTTIDGVGADNSSLKDGNAHKFIMNDMLYILKDGVLYDARGARVK